MNLGANCDPICSFSASKKAPGVKICPVATLTPCTRFTFGSTAALEARDLAGFLSHLVFGGDHDVGLRQRVFEDFVEGGEGRVGEDVGAGDEGDADHDRQGRRQGTHLARPEALDGEAGQRSASSARSPRRSSRGRRRGRSAPSLRVISRSAWAAAAGSWVTMITVWPNSSTAWRSSRSTSPLAFESRLPVGSSAKTTAGLETSARATATRCCWPPESSEGRWVRRSLEPDRVDQPVEPLAVGLAAGDRERQHEVLLGGEHRQQVEELEDEAELVAAQLGQLAVVEVGDLLAVEDDGARGRLGRGRRGCASGSTCRSPTAP